MKGVKWNIVNYRKRLNKLYLYLLKIEDKIIIEVIKKIYIKQ